LTVLNIKNIIAVLLKNRERGDLLDNDDAVTLAISEFIRELGIPITVISKKTALPKNSLYQSLSPSKNTRRRPLRGDELLTLCHFLKIDINQFMPTKDKASPQGGGGR